MSGTQNTNTTLTGDTSEQTIGVRKAAQLLAVAVLAALFAIPVASATETTQPWQPVQTKQPAHALVIRGQALEPDLPPRLLCPHLARQGEHRPEADGGQDHREPDRRIREHGSARVLDPLTTPAAA